MRVIGTAGHVDHGKSTLIAALTGTHPDRLKEEQAREMTIELGFGWLTLPDGEEVGIVDVPGHRDFIENMLAGVGGLDLAMLIIAADEGVMPQTREHLAILDLLQIKAGLVVITKTDLIKDNEWLDLLKEDIRRALKGTILQDAPFLAVSAKTGFGLTELITTLQTYLAKSPARIDSARPRLPIDRVFSMAGFGTVVTGTLTDGHFTVGDEVQIQPSGKTARIRGLQSHKKKEQKALPGSRTAINLTGLSVEDLQRGEVVTLPNQYQPSQRIDARLRLIKDISAPLKHAMQVKVFHGTSETVAQLRLLQTETLSAGEEGWVQLELREPLVAVRGDRFIIRRPSPSETLGGGVVIDPQPKKRYKRTDKEAIKRLEALAQGSPADVLLQALLALGPCTWKQVVAHSQLNDEAVNSGLNELLETQQMIVVEEDSNLMHNADSLVMANVAWNSLAEETVGLIKSYHAANLLKRGIPREELKSKLKLTPKLFNGLIKKLINENQIVDLGNWLARPQHEIRFSEQQQARVSQLLARFDGNPLGPPSVKEAVAAVGEEIYLALIELNELVQVSPEVVFRKNQYEKMVETVRNVLIKQGQLTAAEARDLLQTTRKYALGLLEHLDSIGLTVRDGDFRRLRR